MYMRINNKQQKRMLLLSRAQFSETDYDILVKYFGPSARAPKFSTQMR